MDFLFNYCSHYGQFHFAVQNCTAHYNQLVPVLKKIGTRPLTDSNGDITICTPCFAKRIRI